MSENTIDWQLDNIGYSDVDFLIRLAAKHRKEYAFAMRLRHIAHELKYLESIEQDMYKVQEEKRRLIRETYYPGKG